MRKIISLVAAAIGTLLIALSFTLSTQATCSNANCTPGSGTCNPVPGPYNTGCRDDLPCSRDGNRCYWRIGK